MTATAASHSLLSTADMVVLGPVASMLALGEERPILDYPIAGRPLYRHVIERAAAHHDGPLDLLTSQAWLGAVPRATDEIRRFGNVRVVPGAELPPVRFRRSTGEAQELRYVWDLQDLVGDILRSMPAKVDATAVLERDVEISGNVCVEAGARVLGGARLKGDVYIGRETLIGNGALLRGSVNIGAKGMVGFSSEIKSSTLLEHVVVGPSSAVTDSVLEDDVFLGGLVRISNTHLGFPTVSILADGQRIDSGRKFLGASIGIGARLAGGVRASPGRAIGRRSEVGPGVSVTRNIASFTRVRLKQELEIEELPGRPRGEGERH